MQQIASIFEHANEFFCCFSITAPNQWDCSIFCIQTQSHSIQFVNVCWECVCVCFHISIYFKFLVAANSKVRSHQVHQSIRKKPFYSKRFLHEKLSRRNKSNFRRNKLRIKNETYKIAVGSTVSFMSNNSISKCDEIIPIEKCFFRHCKR